MSAEQAEKFVDNWTYLKIELGWLDRVLMMAVARQRKEGKDVEHVAQSRADRATSHWWKGLISLEGNIANDEYRKPAQQGGASKQNYQQQLEARILASRQHGVILGLPLLRDRLELTVFEKNLVLMSLAPEINRRYARLYRYLQGEETLTKCDLPTVDLVLRLLCRTDQEWRAARNRLMSNSPLVQHKLLRILPRREDTLLNYPLKLEDSLVDYLLAEHPTVEGLNGLLQPLALPAPSQSFLSYTAHEVGWSSLVLPPSQVASLQALAQSIQYQPQVDQTWGFGQHNSIQKGTVAILSGKPGTGKAMAAGAIAHSLNVSLATVDLAKIEPEDYPQLLWEIADQAPTVLLINSANLWLRRSALISDAQIKRFLTLRQATASITLLSLSVECIIAPSLQQQISNTLKFLMPQESDRLRLWKQAFPSQLPLSPELDLDMLAQQLPLTGGEIGAIARSAAFFLAASEDSALNMTHLRQAIEQHGKSFKLKSYAPQPSPKQRKRKQSAKTKSKSVKPL